MKERPSHKYARANGLHMILGTMASESVRRQSAYLKNGCNAYDKREPTSQPLSFWTEQDVLAYLKMTGIPYASVYGEIVEKAAAGNDRRKAYRLYVLYVRCASGKAAEPLSAHGADAPEAI